MAKDKSGGAIGSVTIDKTGQRGGVNPGSAGSGSKRLPYLAQDGGGSSPTDWVPKKTRVIGTGEH